jgi:hypothetical protein
MARLDWQRSRVVSPSNERPQTHDTDETQHERVNRNWNELLQELRVTQTGVQLLAGFLLTLPFQGRFSTLTSTQENVYLAIVVDAFIATGLLVAPVALHRAVFRRQHKEWLVVMAHHLARGGLLLMSLAFAGAVWLVYDVVVGSPLSDVVSGALLAFLIGLWFLLPLTARLGGGSTDG